jgi:MFS family permease
MFWGNLITAMGQGLVWPFLTINMRRQMDVPLTQITVLFTLQSLATMLATTALGPTMDRFGRKGPMVIGYLISSASIFSMSRADTLPAWGVLLALYAIAGASFQMGSNAMIADMIAPDRRVGAYALLRTASNLGIAIGPPIGGLLTGVSYELPYYLAAGIQFVMVFFVFTMLRETLDRKNRAEEHTAPSVGYGPLLHDRPFLTFWGAYLLVEIAAALVFTLLGVYVKEQFSIPESQYSLIMMTNAVMVVFLQYSVTRLTRRYAPLPVMALSGLFYALGLSAFALGRGFLAFWLGMVIMTTGELMISPTATAMAANLAPPDMRARYMGVYGLSYRVGSGVGPVIGGFLSDSIAPPATWFGGAFFALLSGGGFLWLSRLRMLRPNHSMTSAYTLGV